MGKRRIRNLISLGYHDILGFDIRKDRLRETTKRYGIKTFSSIQRAFAQEPSLVIISSWPNTHLRYVKLAIKNKIPFFTEVNTDPDDIQQIIKLMRKYKIMGISSMSMKFHPAIKIIKNFIDKKKLGNNYFVNYHSGENLEDWHPWERVQDYYVKSKSIGGGRDQAVFELEWIFWIFGKPKSVMAKVSKLSKIPARIFDTYQMTFTFKKVSMANVLIDVIQRPPNRIFRLVSEKGLIEWNWITGFVRVFDAKTKKWEEFGHGKGYKGFNVEEMYQEEMKNVIQSAKQKKNLVQSFEEELLVAKSVVIAEQSSKTKKTLKIQ